MNFIINKMDLRDLLHEKIKQKQKTRMSEHAQSVLETRISQKQEKIEKEKKEKEEIAELKRKKIRQKEREKKKRQKERKQNET